MWKEAILEIWGGGGVMVGEYSVSYWKILAIMFCLVLLVLFIHLFIYLTIFIEYLLYAVLALRWTKAVMAVPSSRKERY